MELRQYNFNYNQALQWLAENTGSKVYTQSSGNPSSTSKVIAQDAPRTYYFPHSRHKKNAGQYYFAGWAKPPASFCYIQGDMDGGGFVQPYWNAFVLNQNENIAELMQVENLRFGYVDDQNVRCSFALIYNSLDPKKAMISIIKNADHPAFEKRKVQLFIADFFTEELEESVEIAQADIPRTLKKALGSRVLADKLQNIFADDGCIDINKAQIFAKQELKYWGAQPQISIVEDRQIGLAPPMRQIKAPAALKRYAGVLGGGALGAGLGWLVGAFIMGPLLAPLTFGLSMLFMPYIFSIIGFCLGAAAFCYVRDQRLGCAARPAEPESLEPQLVRSCDGSYARMARRGLQTVNDEKHTVVAEHAPSEVVNLQPLSDQSLASSPLRNFCKI